eukprot:gene40195-49708_t
MGCAAVDAPKISACRLNFPKGEELILEPLEGQFTSVEYSPSLFNVEAISTPSVAKALINQVFCRSEVMLTSIIPAGASGGLNLLNRIVKDVVETAIATPFVASSSPGLATNAHIERTQFAHRVHELPSSRVAVVPKHLDPELLFKDLPGNTITSMSGNGMFYGKVNVDGLPDGFGKWEFASGDSYTGHWLNGKMHGE